MIKELLFLALSLMALLVFLSLRTGRTLASWAMYSEKLAMYRVHSTNARIIFWFTVASVLIVEVMIRLNGGRTETDLLFWVHVSFAGLWLVGLVLLNWPMNGMRTSHHKQVAYVSIIAFLVTAITAVPIILRM